MLAKGDTYCDERCWEFLPPWVKARQSLPEVGYEHQNGQGGVCARTEQAPTFNTEVGLYVTGGKLPALVESHFERLIESGGTDRLKVTHLGAI
jgi:hypothetical protein